MKDLILILAFAAACMVGLAAALPAAAKCYSEFVQVKKPGAVIPQPRIKIACRGEF